MGHVWLHATIAADRSMRIAQISTCHEATPPLRYGSINRIVSELTECLVRRGHEVVLYATGDSSTSARLEYVFEAPSPGFYNIDDDWVHVIKALTTGEHFDLVHNHNIYGGVGLAFLAECDAYLTTVHTKPNMQFLKHFQGHNLVALSESHGRMLASLNPLRVITPGLSPDAYPFTEDKEEYILLLGQIGHHKGTREAIDVAESLGMELRIAGLVAPWNEPYFQAEVKPRLRGRISFVGEVGGTDRLDLLRRARCLILPSNALETFGLVLIEAMACGTPVVGTTRGAIPEVVVPGQTGFLADDLAGLADAVRGCDRLDPRQCREHVLKHFTAERMTDDYEDLYAALSR
jgi:glycosyltransferase involved in cell wall biosynthesis